MKGMGFFLLFATLMWAAPRAQVSAQPAQKAAPPSAQGAPLSDRDLNVQAYIELLRTDLRNRKAQITGVVMQLDASQAAAFWPIYKSFETDYNVIGDQIVALVNSYVSNYDTMTPAVADQLATKLLNVEQQRDDLKRAYYARFKAALDPITAARFLQVENQLENLVDLQIASRLPVIMTPQSSVSWEP